MDACRLTIDALGRFHHTGLECVFHECGGLIAQSGQMGNLVLLDVLQHHFVDSTNQPSGQSLPGVSMRANCQSTTRW